MRAAATSIAIFILALIAFSSCGGNSRPLAVVGPAAFAGMECALPELPAGDEFNPSKIVASASMLRTGDNALHISANVTLVPPRAELNPGPGALAWAVYQFPGSPADIIESVSYNASSRPAGHLVWVAIADYSSDSWEFFAPLDADTATLPVAATPGAYTSPMGHAFVAIMAWDGLGFDVDDVTMTYANRYSVSGQVVDFTGTGIPNVWVTTSLGGPGAITDAAGNYTLDFIPEGTWHVMATKAGYVFFDYPQQFTVAGGPATGVNMWGELNHSHWKPVDSNEPNNFFHQAPLCDPSLTINAYSSVIDDPDDFYRFSLTNVGDYRIEVNGDLQLLFPTITVYDGAGVYMAASGWLGAGLANVGITTAGPQEIVVKVSYAGGGGTYTLDVVFGSWNSLAGEVNSGTNDLGYMKVEADDGSADGICYFHTNPFDGSYGCDYMRELSTVITPDPDNESAYFMWAPPTITAPLDVGDVAGANFSCNALSLDHYEPNNTQGTAYFFPLPLTSHDSILVRESDLEDWYRLTPAVGSHLQVRADVKYFSSWGTPFTLKIVGGSTVIYGYNTTTGFEARTLDPCDGSDYYVQIQAWGDRLYYYQMTIEEFTGYSGSIGVSYLGGGVEGAVVNLYNYDSGWTWTDWTDTDGLTKYYYALRDGETIFAEVFRFGFNCDRFTKELKVSGGDLLYWFDADATSADSYEPNNNNATSTVVGVPADFHASISSKTDSVDNYTVYLTDSDPLHVVFSDAVGGMEFFAQLWERPGATMTDSHTWTGDADFTLVTAGPVDHRLWISANDGESRYRLQID